MAEGDSEEDERFQAEMAAREAFEARFPPEAFEPIAKALKVACTAENVATIRRWLIPDLEQAFSGNPVKEPSIPERKRELTRLRDALALVERASPKWHGAASLPWTIADIGDGVPGQFTATVHRLHGRVKDELHELETRPARRGPKPKNLFRGFAIDLVTIYKGMTRLEAKRPYWLPDSREYGSDFYTFAKSVWECIRICLPEKRSFLPASELALAEELRNYWPKEL